MSQAQKLSILIVDGHALVREGLKLVIRREYGNVVFGEARTAREAMARVKASPWRLVVLDATLPDDNGLSVLGEILACRPQAAVLMLGMDADPLYGARAKQLGASGYVLDGFSHSDVLIAVGNVLDGKKYFSESSPRGGDNRKSATVPPDLSDQECKVLLAVAAGRRTSEIAAELKLSHKTVSTYKHRGFNKLGIKSTADLVRYVIDHKLS
jgi:two-component system invasion response regulator UvrY